VIHRLVDRPAPVAVLTWRRDSLDVVEQQQVRMEGVGSGRDIRQVERRSHEGQPVGTKARQALSEKVFGKTVHVEGLGKDRYKRTLGVDRADADVG
jgi:endonuclease YncB( thermonuclease family)